MAKPVLEMEGITKHFPGVLALDTVSLAAYPGTILSLVGENGAGKSTLMKILSGTYGRSTYEGTVRIDGKECAFHAPSDAEAAGIAMIYQEINTHLDMSITENLFMGRWIHNSRGRILWNRMHEQAQRALEMVDLCVEPDINMRKLNTSQQQLVCIASAVIREPRILVLDEPTSALTESETETLFSIMHRLKEQGIASILISHKLDEVFENSDSITVLRDGKTVGFHNRDDFDRAMIVREMVGRELSEFYPTRSSDPGDVVLRVDGISVPHPGNPRKEIVSNVSFELRKGEVLGLAGLVGSGRSELVNAIFGKIKKSVGAVFIEGAEIDTSTPVRSIAAGLALVTEDRKADGFVELMSIKENISMASMKRVSFWGHMNRKREEKAAGNHFQRLRIKSPDMSRQLLTLSGGNQQKVVFSKWLMTNPKVLLLDEPTRGIDVGAKREIYTIINELVAQGIGILFISSELPELLSMSDRIMVLSGGRKSAEIEKASFSQELIMDYATRFAGEAEIEGSCDAPQSGETNEQ